MTTEAAGVAFLAPGALALFVKRSADAPDHPGEWCFPGGTLEGFESAEEAASREAFEETGEQPGTLIEVGTTPIEGGGYFTTFAARVEEPFAAVLDDESDGFAWAPLADPPQPLHPGVAATLGTFAAMDEWRGQGGIVAPAAPIDHDKGKHSWVRAQAGKKLPAQMTWPGPSAKDELCAEDASPERLLAFDRALGGEGSGPTRPSLAFDYSSERSYDKDGRLHVGTTNISKANICPYRGDEIPNFEALGLEPAKIYQLLRDPAELERAAASFNRLPLLSRHVPVSIADHKPDLVIGATGSDAAFEAPFLKNSLTIWARDALDDVESEVKKELSSAYHYRADMTPGTYQGVPYDGVMRDIVGNHVALVKEGRAGADVVVGDEALTQTENEPMPANQPKQITVRSAMLTGAISAFLLPKLANDQKIDFKGALDGITRANFKTRKPAIITAIKAATAGKLAKDASIDGVAQLLDMIEAHEPGIDADPTPQKTIEGGLTAADPEIEPYSPDALPEFLKGKLNEDDHKKAMDMIGKDRKAAKDEKGPPPFEGKPETGASDQGEKEDEEKVDKKAMDAAIKSAVKLATDQAIKAQSDLRAAERFVRPWVGDLAIACDSAEGVHRAALDVLGIAHKDIHASALTTIIGMQPKPGEKKPGANPAPAMDEKGAADFATMYPEVGRIGLMG